MHRFINLFLTVLAFCLLSCSRTEQPITHRFAIRSEDGLPTAVNSGGSRFPGEILVYEEVLRIEEDSDHPATLLHRPDFRYVRDEAGCIYIADSANQQIVVFDPEGRFVRTFGRRGNGPGEFTRPAIQTFEKGVLGIWDLFQRRTSYYRTDGTFLNSITAFNIRAPLSGLHRYSESHLLNFYHRSREDEAFQYAQAGIAVLDADGDTLADIFTPYIRGAFRVRGEGVSGAGSLPFSGSPDVLFLTGGKILRSTGEQPLLEFFDLEGRLLSRIRFDHDPEPVTGAERDAVTAFLRADADSARAGREGAFERLMYQSVKFPETKAFWSGVEVDDDGYIWLRCADPVFTSGATNPDRFMLLSPAGQYLGDTARPGFMGSVSTGHVLAWDFDQATGAFTPVVYRITSAISGFTYP
jgi:hypothetical protein